MVQNTGRIRLKYSVSIAAIVVVAGVAPIAGAQERVTDTITVTAERREENLQSTPVAVTAFTEESLRDQQIRDTADLGYATPSLQLTPSGGNNPLSPQTQLRGQQQNAINLTNDPSVALYIDDIYIGKDAGSTTDFLDMQRVEVLKGPQGTLFGRNSTGGAIRYISNKPKLGELEGSMRAGYGNYDSILGQGVLNLPLGEVAAARFAVSYRKHDGHTSTTLSNLNLGTGVVTPVKTLDTNDLDSLLMRGSVVFEPADNFSLLLTGSYHDKKLDGVLSIASIGDLPGGQFSAEHQADFWSGVNNDANSYGETPESTGNPRGMSSEGFLLSGTADWRANDAFGAKVIVGYMDNRAYNGFFDVDGSVTPISSTVTIIDWTQFSTELQFSGVVMDDRLDYIVGAYFQDEDGTDRTGPSRSLGSAGPATAQTFGVVNNSSLSGFAHLKYRIGEATTIQAGGRYTNDKKDLMTNAAIGVLANPMAPTCPYPATNPTLGVVNDGTICSFDPPEASFSFWSYTFGIDHQISEGVFAYLRTGRGQRSGGLQLRSSNGDITPFLPEVLTDYEIGLKLDLLDNRLRLNTAYFFGDYESIQFTRIVPIPMGGTTTVVANVGNAKVQGVEIELNAVLPAGFGFDGNFSWNSVDYDDPAQQQFQIPEYQYNAAITYDADLGMGDLSARLGWYRRSDLQKEELVANNVNPFLAPVPSFDVLNGRIGLTLDNGVDLSFFAKNILKEEYYSDALNLGSQFLTFYPGEPRIWGFEVGYSF